MTRSDQIFSINKVLQEYMRERGLSAMRADEAAQVVYDAGAMVPGGPPGAPGFAFRDFLREISKCHGYDALNALVGVTQAGNRPQGRYVIHRFDPPNKETIEELLKSVPDATSERSSKSTLNALPDHLEEGLDVVFVGISAGEDSAGQHHYYADPHDRFWDLVNESDLVSDIVGAENDHLILDEKCGLTELARKNTPGTDPGPQTIDFDLDGFTRKMEAFKPKVVAFNGQRAYKEALKKDAKDYGLADDIIGDSYVFVLPSSSGTDTSLTFHQKLHWYKKLKATLRTL